MIIFGNVVVDACMAIGRLEIGQRVHEESSGRKQVDACTQYAMQVKLGNDL